MSALRYFFRLLSLTTAAFAAAYMLLTLILFLSLGDLPNKWGGLSSNLFAGSVDTFLAVVLLNFIIAYQADKRTEPLRFAAYLSFNAALSALLGTWSDLVKASCRTVPALHDDLLSAAYIRQVVDHLDVSADSARLGLNCEQCLVASANECKSLISDAMLRYASAIEPECFSAMTALLNSHILGMLSRFNAVQSNLSANSESQLHILQVVGGLLSEDQVGIIKLAHECVIRMSEDIRAIPGHIEPYSFARSIEIMHMRDDIAPRLGSGYR